MTNCSVCGNSLTAQEERYADIAGNLDFQECLACRKKRRAEPADEIGQLVVNYFKDMYAGRCPVCHEMVREQVQRGRCVYGLPCNHRMYQGEVGAFTGTQ